MEYRQQREGEQEPTNWELYRLIVDIHREIQGNGQPGLKQIVGRHDTWLKSLWAVFALLATSGVLGKLLGLL